MFKEGDIVEIIRIKRTTPEPTRYRYLCRLPSRGGYRVAQLQTLSICTAKAIRRWGSDDLFIALDGALTHASTA